MERIPCEIMNLRIFLRSIVSPGIYIACLTPISSKIKSMANQQQRIEIKEKILKEMKKGTEKENFFSDEERVILSRFINKILKELKTEPPK